MYARVSKVMAQFVLKIEKLSHIMGPTPILEMARAYGLRPRLWLLVKGRVDLPCTKVQKEKAKLLKTPKTNKTILQRIKCERGFLYPVRYRLPEKQDRGNGKGALVCLNVISFG